MTKTSIKDDLTEQLNLRGVHESYYIDLVNDYISLWDVKTMLIKDIKERGVSIAYNNGGGQNGQKKNDSVDQLIKVNGQMLKILSELGIEPTGQGEEDDEL